MSRAKAAARTLQRAVIRTAMRVLPHSPHVVINGFPDSEGNGVEMVRACAARYPGRVVWLVRDVAKARQIRDAAGIDPQQRVEIVPHASAEGMRAFATAEVSMFTHGLYGSPRPVRGKTMVNLWHGGGFKGAIMADERGRPTIWSDFLIASCSQFGAIRARECRLPDGGLLVTGNPRIDQFQRSSSADLRPIGLEEGERFVVWMPTFRRNAGHGLSGGWSDVQGERVDVNAVVGRSVELLRREFGLRVVVKPHPSDAESRAIPGAIVVTNDDLAAAGIQLYELVGAADGLLTDYSSVWIDYLAVDRPIGFVVPDEAGYTAGRGFNPPDALDWLPGPRLQTEDDVRAFAADVLAGGSASAARRREVAAHIGHASSSSVADDILDALSARGVFSKPLLPRRT